ncbi:MAG: apolipoprotein N-acyltransferase [Rhodocyclaceae bacterium]
MTFPRNAFGTRAVLIASLLLGAISVFGFAPFYLFPLPFLALAGAVFLWHRAPSAGSAALQGFFFGCGLFLAGVSWVYVSLHQFGGMPAVLAGVATVLFCAYLALFPALAAWAVAKLRSGHPVLDCLVAASAWTLAEWLRGWVFTGFPWLALGYSQSPPSPLAGFAPLVGCYGLSFIVALLAASLALSLGHRLRTLWAGGLVVAVAALGMGWSAAQWTRPKTEPLTVSLLQGNIEQNLKWRPEHLLHSMQTYLQLARSHPAHLVVLPETALPIVLDDLAPDYLAELAAATAPGGDALLGIVTGGSGGRYQNAAVSAADPSKRYSKSHLVPFGEFTPPGFAWSLALLHIPMSDFARGAARQAPIDVAGEKVALNICYEDLFGEEIIRALPEATLLVNISNVAWFGDSLAPPQHLQIAQLRALETGRFMVRATNTGKTAVVDPRGVVAAQLPTFVADALVAEVRGYTGLTPYARWGNWPVVILALLILGVAARRRKARS